MKIRSVNQKGVPEPITSANTAERMSVTFVMITKVSLVVIAVGVVAVGMAIMSYLKWGKGLNPTIINPIYFLSACIVWLMLTIYVCEE